MFKFCTQCGAKMPQENLFCTQCGAKFSMDTTVQQTASNPKIMDIALPKNVQVTKQEIPNQPVNKKAQAEFILGKEFMNRDNPLHDYEKAIVHLKNAMNLGIKEASIYIALSHLYLAEDIIKTNSSVMVSGVNALNAVNGAISPNSMPSQSVMAGNMHYNGKNQIQTPPRNQSNNNSNSSNLQNIGKYAAAAAVGAVAGSMLHSATASAAGHIDEQVPGNITTEDLVTPELQSYADNVTQEAEEYVPPIDEAGDHIQAYDDVSEDIVTETVEENSVADSIEPAEDDSSLFDSNDSSEDDSSLFDDLF